MEFATTILKQLGGRRFIAMTGTKNLVCNEKDESLSMELKRNNLKAKYLRITLRNDLYDMEFFSINRKFDLVSKYKIEGVYADMLQSVFTEQTGLYTSF